MAFIPVSAEANIAAVAHEISKRCPLWTFSRDWKPGAPYPLEKAAGDRTVLLFETVADIVERPARPYQFHPSYRERGTPVTLLERMLLELESLKRDGSHWRDDFWSVCNGSRCYGEYVPMARWFRGSFVVHFKPLSQEQAPDEHAFTVHFMPRA